MTTPRDQLRQFLSQLPPGAWLRIVGAALALILLAAFGLIFLAGGVIALAGWALYNRYLGRPTTPSSPPIIEAQYTIVERESGPADDRR